MLGFLWCEGVGLGLKHACRRAVNARTSLGSAQPTAPPAASATTLGIALGSQFIHARRRGARPRPRPRRALGKQVLDIVRPEQKESRSAGEAGQEQGDVP